MLEKEQLLVSSIFLLAAAFWLVTLLPVGIINAAMIISPAPSVPVEQPPIAFQEVISHQPAPVIKGFDPVEINNASDFIQYYFGGEGEIYLQG